MNILVIGSGGREHALAWKCAQADRVNHVYVAPGNAGTSLEPTVKNITLDVLDFPALAQFAEENEITLTIVGPEAPLVEGIVDFFQEKGLPCFGPSRAAAQLEGSKAFSKDFLKRHGIPTAAFETFTDTASAVSYVQSRGAPIVIKADGLAAGKGVIVAETEAQAIAAVEDMLQGNKYGDAGHRVVIEDFLVGEEASFIAMVDGENILPMASSQDHKARDDGDKGPNTGGMGAYSPAPVVSHTVHERIMEQVIRPTVAGMTSDGHPYVGFLYAGLMIDQEGNPSVVEFNCRFGDPEAQPVMMRLQSDLTELCQLALAGRLDSARAHWDERPAVGVVLAAGGYPDNYQKGTIIKGLDAQHSDSQKIFHAGTREENGQVLTHGGRVLCAAALGQSVAAAQRSAYELAAGISWENVYFRTDIAHRAIAREND
ncbi:MAG: phosphoribosylamine--glycine ligase [Pseudomonadota bacterium]|nr:phosphoribosylamine--glycine ligase [Pseudomonadota bacterium]